VKFYPPPFGGSVLFPGRRHGDADIKFRHSGAGRCAHRRLRSGQQSQPSPAELRERLAAIPGIADAHLQQEVDAPEFYAVIDRARAAQFGWSANSIATT